MSRPGASPYFFTTSEAKHQIGHASDAVFDFAGADREIQQLGEVEKSMVLAGRRDRALLSRL